MKKMMVAMFIVALLLGLDAAAQTRGKGNRSDKNVPNPPSGVTPGQGGPPPTNPGNGNGNGPKPRPRSSALRTTEEVTAAAVPVAAPVRTTVVWPRPPALPRKPEKKG